MILHLSETELRKCTEAWDITSSDDFQFGLQFQRDIESLQYNSTSDIGDKKKENQLPLEGMTRDQLPV
jgi:hypothetical protein